LPDLPQLDQAQARRAIAIFNKLRLPDVVGTPALAEAGADWFREIVGALHGSFDPVARERMIREVFLLAPKKSSKALALDTLIATPDGFTAMGALSVGDMIIDADGLPTRIVARSPVFVGRPCFEVVFSTGESVVCDAEHLGVTDAHRDRQRQGRANRARPCPTTKTTAEIAASLTVPSGRLTINNHRTALAGALNLPDGIAGNDRVVGITQGWKLTRAIKTAERKLADGTLMHDGSRLMAWAVGNARVEPRGNAIAITKQASGTAKIDPLMAAFNAVALMAMNPKSTGRSYLGSSDLMAL
jgi:hypothetical protein